MPYDDLSEIPPLGRPKRRMPRGPIFVAIAASTATVVVGDIMTWAQELVLYLIAHVTIAFGWRG